MSSWQTDDAKEAARDQAWREQQEILARRRNPEKSAEHLRSIELRREESAKSFREKFAWQKDTQKDPLIEFKRRQKEGKLNPLGYEDEPKGGIPMPMASFGVGGEFGQGGKYDNGERFDLRLPYAEQGWVDEGDEEAPVDFFQNLLSGGKLQREADERRRKREQ